MLIPIGQVNSEVRRLPWVTIALLSINTLVFVLMTIGGADKENAVEVRKRTIHLVQYWQEHPYLELPKELAEYFGNAKATRLRKQIEIEQQQMRRANVALPEASQVAEEQVELSRRGASLVEAFQANSSYRYGFVPARKTVTGVLFSMFMHGGWMHLIGNMLFLYITAAFLEDVWGRPLFAGFYLLAGVVAAFSHAAKYPDAMTPLIGASGAIAGVMGAFLIRLGQSRIKFLFMPILFLPFIRWTFSLPAFVVLPFWFVEQLIYNMLIPDAGVAWWAHIGGFLFGMGFAVAVGVAKIEERFIHPAIEKEIGWQQNPGLTRAGEARAAGDWERSRAELGRVLRDEPNNADAWKALYDTEFLAGRIPESARAATRLLEIYVAANEAELASALIDEGISQLEDDLPAKFILMAASYREKQNDLDTAYDLYERIVVTAPSDPAAVRSLIRMAQIELRAQHPTEAWRLLAYAKLHPACVDAWKANVDRLLETVPAPISGATGKPPALRNLDRGAPIRYLPEAAAFLSPGVSPAASKVAIPAAPRHSAKTDPFGTVPVWKPPTAPVVPAAAPSFPSASPVDAPPASGISIEPQPARAAASASRPSSSGFLGLVESRWAFGTIVATLVIVAAILAIALRSGPEHDELLVHAPLRTSSNGAAPPAPTVGAPPVAVAAPAVVPASALAPAALPNTAATPAPVPNTQVSSAEAAPMPAEVDLLVSFQSTILRGQVIVKRNDLPLFSKTFDFGKEGPAGLIEGVATVPTGACELRVWVISFDHSVNEYKVLPAVLTGDEPPELVLELQGGKSLALHLR